MNLREKLDLMISSLTEKGYDGYILSLDVATGKIDEIAAEYQRQNCEKKVGDYKDLWLTTYPIWNAKEEANVSCELFINMQKENLVVEKFLIEKIGQFGGLMNRRELNDVSISMVPTLLQAVEFMKNKPQNKATIKSARKFRR